MINTIRKIKEKVVSLFTSPKEEDIECAIDENIVECKEMDTPSYTGVPAPAYLEYDEWFEPPTYSAKQLDYMEQETMMKLDEREAQFSVEPEDIHQRMYEIATRESSTTLHIDPPGGSENYQETGWLSGKRS